LTAAVATLQQDVADAGNQSSYAGYVTQANANIASANTVIAAIAKYLAGSNVGEAMVASVNHTITAVNGQLRTKSPNIDAIAQSGAILTSFLNANAGLKSSTQAAALAVGQNPKFASHGSGDPLEARFQMDMLALQSQLTAAQAIIANVGSVNTATISQCQAQFAADSVVTVEPAGPITLAPGASVSLKVTGKAPFRLQWVGDVPSTNDVSVTTNFDQVSVSAASGAKTHSYSFVVVEVATSKTSATVQLNIGTAAAPGAGGGANGGAGSTVTASSAQQAIITKLGLATVQSLLGLDATVGPTAPAWTNRVSKLENCVGISPTTGLVSDALVTDLKARAPVNTTGDCPAKLPGAPPPAAAPAAPTPIAAPPATPAPATTAPPVTNTAPIPPSPPRQ
jgi:hypothetical protein